MAEQQQPTQQSQDRTNASGGRSGKAAGGCLAVAAVLVVVAMGLALFGIQAAAQSRLASELQKAAPADSWDISLPLLAVPRLALGQKADVTFQGQNVQTPGGGPRLADLELQIKGLVVDRARARIKAVDAAQFAVLIGSEGLTTALLAETNTAKGLKDPTVSFDDGNLTITGQVDLGHITQMLGLPSFARLSGSGPVSITAVPRLAGPSTIALDVARAEVAGRDMTSAIRPLLAADLKLDFSQDSKAPTFETLDVTAAGLRVTGSLPPAYLTQ